MGCISGISWVEEQVLLFLSGNLYFISFHILSRLYRGVPEQGPVPYTAPNTMGQMQNVNLWDHQGSFFLRVLRL